MNPNRTLGPTVSGSLKRDGMILGAVAFVGFLAIGYRFVFGLGAATNLSDQYPWGLWKAFNVVAGIAVAAGGFTTTAFVHVFHRERFHSLARPALLVAAMGYTFAVIGLVVDIGRYYSIWHPILPSMWQGDSVLFEVALCVMTYLTIMYLELVPVVCERLRGLTRAPRIVRWARALERAVVYPMPFLLVAGVVVSCLHQSSLGNLMLVAREKMNPLWYTPILSLLFLMSAVTVGFPVVILGSSLLSKAARQPIDAPTLLALSRCMPPLLGIYLAAKVIDLTVRGAYATLDASSFATWAFLVEMVVGLVIPLALLLSNHARRSMRLALWASGLVVLGVVLNRLNVVLVAYRPLYATEAYVPSLVEVLVSVGLVAAMLLVIRVAVEFLPIIESAGTAHAPTSRRIALPGHAGALSAVLAVIVVLTPDALASTHEPGATLGTLAVANEKSSPEVSCGACHACDKPSEADACLRECGRLRGSSTSKIPVAVEGPDVVILGHLSDLYLPVPFDHLGHARMADMAGGCVLCHHHTPEGSEHPACRTCHEVEGNRADITKPGLKGAYHRQCLSCHRDWSGETSCGICHRPKSELARRSGTAPVPTPGDIIGRMHPPIPEPDEERYEATHEDGKVTSVLFRHRQHVQGYGLRCSECHREDGCNRCHGEHKEHVQQVRTFEQHHNPCLDCHRDDTCEACHVEPGFAAPSTFTHDRTGWPLARYHADKSCRACHASVPFGRLDRTCDSCHANWSPASFDHGVTGQVLDDNHRQVDCIDCHAERAFDKPPACGGCHDEGDGVTFPERRPGPLLTR